MRHCRHLQQPLQLGPAEQVFSYSPSLYTHRHKGPAAVGTGTAAVFFHPNGPTDQFQLCTSEATCVLQLSSSIASPESSERILHLTEVCPSEPKQWPLHCKNLNPQACNKISLKTIKSKIKVYFSFRKKQENMYMSISELHK